MILKGKQALAYTAGIIDGEGCISINRRDKKAFTYDLVVSVWNTNQWLVEWLKMSYGGTIIFRNEFSTKSYQSKKPIWKWAISQNKAKDFLELILPYLQLKAPEAELAIAFQNKKRQRPKTPEQLAVLEAQRIVLSRMKIKQSGRRSG